MQAQSVEIETFGQIFHAPTLAHGLPVRTPNEQRPIDANRRAGVPALHQGPGWGMGARAGCGPGAVGWVGMAGHTLPAASVGRVAPAAHSCRGGVRMHPDRACRVGLVASILDALALGIRHPAIFGQQDKNIRVYDRSGSIGRVIGTR